jgi:hypothetical protein
MNPDPPAPPVSSPDRPIRPVEACPHRDPAGPSCRLVAAVVGVDLPGSGLVGWDACRACCAGPVPDALRVGPVVASLVAKAAESAVRAGGVEGLDAGRAEGLKRWARNYLIAAGPELATAYTPPRLTRPCHFLGGPIGPATGVERSCLHPSHETTTPDGCLLCRDWTDRPRPGSRPLEELLPAPPRRGPAVRHWAVGVTTSPRGRPTLDWTLDSLARAGWDDPRVFEDLPTTIAPRHAGRPLSTRIPALGAWPNFYLGLAELVVRHPEADAYFMVQDDVLFYDRQDLREYLERILWPSAPPGPISLYCPSFYSRPGSSWHRFEGSWAGGALAFIFPREQARQFVADPRVLAHRWSEDGRGLVAIDAVVGAWAHCSEIPVYFPCPSLAQHIGDVSTLWSVHSSNSVRLADRFLADVEVS